MAYCISVDRNGFADMDQLKSFLDKLPPVQQVAVQEHITNKFHNEPVDGDMAKARARWLYSQPNESKLG